MENKIELIFPVSEVKDTKEQTFKKLGKLLRDNGIPAYYDSAKKDIVVQHGVLGYDRCEDAEGWKFTWLG